MRTEVEVAKLRKIIGNDLSSAELLKSLNDFLLTGASPKEVNEMLLNLKRIEKNHSPKKRAMRENDGRKPTFREPPRPKKEILLKPHYYHAGSIDVIRYAEENFSPEELKGFYRLNVFKYVTRYDKKNGVEDLQKANDYLQKLVELEKRT